MVCGYYVLLQMMTAPTVPGMSGHTKEEEVMIMSCARAQCRYQDSLDLIGESSVFKEALFSSVLILLFGTARL